MARYMTLGPVPMPDGTSATRPSFFDDDWHPDRPDGAIPVTQAQVDHYAARQPWCHWDAGAGDWVDDPVPALSAPAPTVTGNQWAFALKACKVAAAWRVAAAKASDADQIRLDLISRDTPLQLDDPLLVRVAAGAGFLKDANGNDTATSVISVPAVMACAQGMPT